MPQLTLQQAMAHAAQLVQARRFAEAESIYQQVLQQRPDDPDAIHCLGVIAHQKGDVETAIRLIRRATELQPQQAIYHGNLGDLLLGRGEFDEAEKALRLAIQLNPSFPQALMKLGMVVEKQSKLEEAEQLYRQAIAIAPDYAAAHCNLGDALFALGKPDDAIAAYTRAIALDPNLAEAYGNRGNVLDSLDRADEAANDFFRAIQIKPLFNPLRGLAVYCYEHDRDIEAADYFRRALAIDPNSGVIHSGLSLAYMRLGRIEEARAQCLEAMRCDPTLIDPYVNLGLIHRDLGEYDQALAAFEQAEKVDPECHTLYANRALVYLVRGDFEQGFRDYDHRWQLAEFTSYGREYKCPRWEGADLAGKSILLWHEQGMGDTIHFIRYAKILADRGARVIAEIQRPLHRLLRNVQGVSQVIARDDPLPELDFHAPFLSLPGILKTSLDTIPADVPYISAEPELIQQWADRLGERRGMRVGITWRGLFKHRLDPTRSITPAHFAPLSQVANVQLVSLQKREPYDPPTNPPTFPLLDLTDQIGDFSDTAALIENLDLVISVDTSVVHLAGAMARPVWTLLPFVPDWRWLLDRPDSPWYPTMKLFRQPRRGDWTTPITEAAAALKSLAARDETLN